MQRSHRRSTRVCTRCRKRKTKCDFELPACTSCKLAQATCLGFDPITREAVPRSLVRSLEARVAELEAQVLTFQRAPCNAPIQMASSIAQAIISFNMPSSRTLLSSKISSALLLRPSCPPLAVVREWGEVNSGNSVPLSNGERPAKAGYPSNAVLNLNSIPFPAIRRMIQNYTDIHLPQYPCISESMLEQIIERLKNRGLGDTSSPLIYGAPVDSGLDHFEFFVFFITLAISAMTLTWKAEDQARGASESFFNSAIKHLQALKSHSEIKTLQVYLLLAHYAHMCPERVDNWTCIANAVRIVLNLGLYKQPPEMLPTDQKQQRAELFWVTYGMERSLCVNLRLPLSFPEEAVAIKSQLYASDLQRDDIFATHDLKRKSSANHICQYRALETEVHRILHQEESLSRLGSTTVGEWIKDISHRLEVWYGRAQRYTQYNMLEFQHIQFHHLRVRIHRPTPRLRTRDSEDHRIVLESALILIQDYLGQQHHRRLFYPWHGTHILFETAVVSMNACWLSRHCKTLQGLVKQVLHRTIPEFLQLLTGIGKHWKEASRCAERLRRLVQKIMSSAFFETETIDSPSAWHDHTSITEEIEGLLFSDGPLPQSRAAGNDDFPVSDNNSVFMDNAINDAIQLFQWDPEWAIMPTGSMWEDQSSS